MEDVLPTESNQGEEEYVKEQKQSPITVLSEEEIVSRKKRVKVVEFTSITHQGKVLKMSEEVGAVWRPTERLKNKLRLNMKKLLNPKLAEKKVTIIENSSSQEKLGDSEDDNKEVIKGKKQ